MCLAGDLSGSRRRTLANSKSRYKHKNQPGRERKQNTILRRLNSNEGMSTPSPHRSHIELQRCGRRFCPYVAKEFRHPSRRPRAQHLFVAGLRSSRHYRGALSPSQGRGLIQSASSPSTSPVSFPLGWWRCCKSYHRNKLNRRSYEHSPT
jgi:hypothetical protein